MTDLKPCPFCGGSAEVNIHHWDSNVIGADDTSFTVDCKICPGGVGDHDLSEEEIVSI